MGQRDVNVSDEWSEGESRWRKPVRFDDFSFGEKMERAILRYETTLHAINQSDWNENNPNRKYVKILYYCLYHHAISSAQLFAAHLSDATSIPSCSKLLNRLVQKGLLLSAQRQLEVTPTMLYFLSNAGLETCLDQMMEISTSYGYPLTEEDLLLLGTRSRNWKMKKGMTHFMSLRDMNAYLLGNPFLSEYQYLIEPDIDMTGTIIPLRERLKATGVTQGQGNIRSDAALLLPCRDITYTFYLEQDTGAQRSPVVGKKLDAYLNTVVGARGDKYRHSLLFSILTSPLPPKRKKSDGVPASVLYYTLAVPNLCYFLHIATDESNSLLRLVELYREYVDKMTSGECEESQFARNLLVLMESVLVENVDISVDNFLILCRNKASQRVNERMESDDAVHNQSYRNRRRLLQSAISGVNGVDDAVLEGFSVYFSPNRRHGDVVPYLMPELFNGTFQVHGFFQLCGENCREYELTFSPISSTLSVDRFVLRNKYVAPSGFTVYVENISDDYGGMVRLKRYLERPEFHDGRGVLLCLVDTVSESQLWNMVSDTDYWKYIVARLVLPLRIVFVSYSDFAKRRGFLEFREPERLSPFIWVD